MFRVYDSLTGATLSVVETAREALIATVENPRADYVRILARTGLDNPLPRT